MPKPLVVRVSFKTFFGRLPMEDCIFVRYNEGFYEIPPGSTIEAWDVVASHADNIEHLEHLMGWGRWTDAYRITINGGKVVYFVDLNS